MLISQRHERPGATAILKRGSTFPRQTDGVTLCWIQGKSLLQANLVLPAISQVIFINPAFFAAEMEVTESHLMRIVAEAYAAGLPDPIRLAPNEKLVQMFISPAKGNLERVMELGNGVVAAHQEATPYLGTDFADPDTQLIDLHRLLCAAHAFPLLPYLPTQSISASAHEGKQVGTFIASRRFVPGMEWSPLRTKISALNVRHHF